MRSATETPNRPFLLTVLASAALLGALLLLPASGQAQNGGPPEEDCAAHKGINVMGWGDACFEAHGDAIWVRDQDPNGWGVGVQVQTNYLTNNRPKIRWCLNTHGADTWLRCKFDHRENGCVRWRMYEQNAAGQTQKWTRPSAWYSIALGEALCPREFL
jgi:hypothetical protein